MKRSVAEIEREYGPFAEGQKVHGVTIVDGEVWFAAGDRLQSFAPDTGAPSRSIAVAADAGTTFDGTHLWQIAGERIHRIDPHTGEVLGSIPAPGKGRDSGLAWADGSLWVGQYRDRQIHRIDPNTGEILRTIASDRFVTGVTWVDGELWHGAWDDERSELRRIDPESGAPQEVLQLPEGKFVTGLESDGERFFCGGGSSGKVRVVRRPRAKQRSGAAT